ncbi:conjugative transposon protein TraJ [Mucilaginibacter pedocola]|uniref:conjugative transposon protein TraJ n=1 Tax=Mucilaginibacter pedocola TaxID=1792845 RepID=UPI00293721DD|nr:conjugative transposon protein TraJ [Mucilaginibacter pedocola]
MSHANGLADNIGGLQGTLDNVYNEMLPMCSGLIGTARAIAGFGALWYIAARVYRHLANAEPIDFYPLLRPFALGMAILLFPVAISVINGIMKPTVTATGSMVKSSDEAIARLLKAKEEALKQTKEWQAYVGNSGNGDEDKWYKYTHPDDEDGKPEKGIFSGMANSMKFWMDKQAYAFKNNIKQWMSNVLEVVFQAAALCINTIRSFILIVLAILGPLVLGLSVFDGLQSTLTQWLARYINTYLWLPVANIFGAIIGKVQEHMISLDITQVHETGSTFFSSADTAYIIFLIIGIAGYFCVPSVAGYIVHAAGGSSLVQRVNTLVIQSSTSAANTTISAGTAIYQKVSDLLQPRPQAEPPQSDQYMRDKLSGK